ncbi:hypothetical protein CCP3SC1AL1_680010 [Gammaproteobacteria bacterium]
MAQFKYKKLMEALRLNLLYVILIHQADNHNFNLMEMVNIFLLEILCGYILIIHICVTLFLIQMVEF